MNGRKLLPYALCTLLIGGTLAGGLWSDRTSDRHGPAEQRMWDRLECDSLAERYGPYDYDVLRCYHELDTELGKR